MNNRILEKIKKCLRLAQSDNAAEAAAALRQAQKLMAKHGLTSSDVELADVEKHRAKSVRSANPPEWVWYLMHTISRAFGVEHVNHVRRGPDTRWAYQSHADFIGVGSNPQVASYAFSVLFRQLRKDRANYLGSLPMRVNRSIKTRRADLFAMAWVNVVSDKVTEMAMPKEHKALVERWKEQQYGPDGIEKAKDRSHSPGLNAGDIDALHEGRAAGSRVDLHHGVGANQAPEQLTYAHGSSACPSK